MPTIEQNQKIESLIRSLPIPSRSINVFGSIRCNVHIKCESKATARKWMHALSKTCRTVNCVETVDYLADNEKRINAPRAIPVYLVAGIV